jgi:hypothetical protein
MTSTITTDAQMKAPLLDRFGGGGVDVSGIYELWASSGQRPGPEL